MRTGRRRSAATAVCLVALACAPPPDPGDAGTETLEESRAPELGTISADEFELRYVIDGTGTPAIVIGSSVYLPRAFSIDLRNHLRMVFLDHRGYAPSPGPMERTAFTEDKILEDVERARQQLGLDRVIIMGHSIHSIMALEYAKRYPDSVSHVVMIGSPRLDDEADSLMEGYWEELASPERKSALELNRQRLPDDELGLLPPGERVIRRYIREGPRTWYDAHFDASVLWEGVESNDDYGPAQPFRDVDVLQGVDVLEQPVFLALGRYDFLVAPPSTWEAIQPQFQDMTLKVFDRSGHWPHYEEPDAFDAELLRWLEKNP